MFKQFDGLIKRGLCQAEMVQKMIQNFSQGNLSRSEIIP